MWYIVLWIIAAVLLILFASVLFMIKPNLKRDLSPFVGGYFAHRGLHDNGSLCPENSLPAFLHAKQHGFGVELDVQLTKDKQLIVFHDSSLSRMVEGEVDEKICNMTYAEIKEYTLKGGNERVPLFSEVLDVLDGAPVICEIKTHTSNTDTEVCSYVCEHIDRYTGKVCIESFSPFIVKWFRERRPDIIRGQLSTDFIKDGGLSFVSAVIMKHLLLNFLGRPDFIAYNFTHCSIGLRLCRDIFKPLVVAWTVRSESGLIQAKIHNQAYIFENFIPKTE